MRTQHAAKAPRALLQRSVSDIAVCNAHPGALEAGVLAAHMEEPPWHHDHLRTKEDVGAHEAEQQLACQSFLLFICAHRWMRFRDVHIACNQRVMAGRMQCSAKPS